jgi:acetylornithine/N-succinyldiaminopimelate aminotransferase
MAEPRRPAPPSSTAFVDRYGRLFGREQALMLRMSGLAAAECHAEGARVTDSAGRTWLDFGSFGLHLLGHRHPHVTDALVRQVGSLGLSTKILPNEAITDAAHALRSLVGRPNDMVMFGNSGSESVECALKLARIATGRAQVVALVNGYHGRTAGALAVSHGYRAHASLCDAAHTSFLAAGDLDALEAVLSGGDIAAMILEPVQGEGGIRPLARAELEAAYALCERHGTIMIHDEIQTGLGRAGSVVSGAPADIVLFGKTLGGGVFPVAATVYDGTRFSAAARDPVVHASSYGGSPLAGAVVSAVTEVVGGQGFCDRVTELGARARAMLVERLSALPGVVEIRGRGLMLGVEFERHETVAQAVIESARRGILTAFCLTATRVVRVYPPAVTSDDDLADGLARFCDACETALQQTN